MASSIETLLGLNVGPKANMKALAGKLRGEQDLGRFLSLSTIPQVSALGAADRKSVETAAKRGGVLRQSIAKDAESKRRFDIGDVLAQKQEGRAVTAEARAVQERAEEAADFDYEEFEDQEGNVHGLRKLKGKNYWVDADDKRVNPGREGWTKMQKKGTRGDKIVNVKMNGVEVMYTVDPYTGERSDRVISATGEPATPENIEKYKRQEIETERSTEHAKELAALDVENIGNIEEDISGMKMTLPLLKEAVSALDSGAKIGPVMAKFVPTFSAATAKIENMQAALGLQMINKYSLTPVSDKDMKIALQVGLNLYQDESDARAALIHKHEVITRSIEASEYIADEKRGERRPDKNVIDDILYSDGFSFEPPALKGDIQKPDWAPDGWWKLTPEQKRTAIGNYQG